MFDSLEQERGLVSELAIHTRLGYVHGAGDAVDIHTLVPACPEHLDGAVERPLRFEGSGSSR